MAARPPRSDSAVASGNVGGSRIVRLVFTWNPEVQPRRQVRPRVTFPNAGAGKNRDSQRIAPGVEARCRRLDTHVSDPTRSVHRVVRPCLRSLAVNRAAGLQCCAPVRSPQWSECGSHLTGEELGLFPGGEVPAALGLVEVG